MKKICVFIGLSMMRGLLLLIVNIAAVYPRLLLGKVWGEETIPEDQDQIGGQGRRGAAASLEESKPQPVVGFLFF